MAIGGGVYDGWGRSTRRFGEEYMALLDEAAKCLTTVGLNII